MLLDTNVRVIKSTQTTAQIDLKWDSFIKVLDEVLVNGTVPAKATSFRTIDKGDHWEVSITTEAPHTLLAYTSVIEITGADGYNGVHRVQDVPSPYLIKVALAKTVSKPADILDSEATFRLPPLGFTKPFASEYIGVYKGEEGFLRVDCTPVSDLPRARFARVSMFTDMTGVDDYKARFGRQKAPFKREEENWPEEGKPSEGRGLLSNSRWFLNYVGGSEETSNYPSYFPSTSKFTIIGDSRTFYLILEEGSYGFGSFYSEESYNTFLCSTRALVYKDGLSQSTTNRTLETLAAGHTPSLSLFNSHILDENINESGVGRLFAGGMKISSRETGISFNQWNRTLVFQKVFIIGEYAMKKSLAGEMRGLYWIQNDLQEDPSYANTLTVIHGTKREPSKKFLLQKCMYRGGSGIMIAFELGDWE